MATMKRLLAYMCKIVLVGFVITALSPAQQCFAQKGKAYIWVGDINPPWYSLMIRSVNPFGPVDPYKEIKPVIDAQRKKMEEMGYEVVEADTVSAHEIEKAMRDPQTKAFAFFGHGDQKVAGTMSTLAGEDITAGDIKGWAQEELAKQIGTPDTWRNLSTEERKKLYNAWKDAHFNMKYVYMHTCYGLKDDSMVDAVIADDGEFRGYKDKAYTSDNSVSAKNEMGRLEEQLKDLQAQHNTLKKKLDASGGHDEDTAKKMQDIYKDFQKVRADIEKKKVSRSIIAAKTTPPKKDEKETKEIAPADKDKKDVASKDGKAAAAPPPKESVPVAAADDKPAAAGGQEKPAGSTDLPAAGSVSATAEWGAYHLKYTISGASLVTPPEYKAPFGFDIYNYTGKLAGDTLTVSGTGWSDNETSDVDFPYVLSVSVSAGDKSQTFEYKAPVKEKLNKPFSLSVPVPAGATSGSFSMSVIYINSKYGNRGVQVGGALKR